VALEAHLRARNTPVLGLVRLDPAGGVEPRSQQRCTTARWASGPATPDVVEEVFGPVRRARVPRVAKYARTRRFALADPVIR
jgi:hypothetical protein